MIQNNIMKALKTSIENILVLMNFDKNYKEMLSIIEIILALSHAQAAAERNFSLGKSFVVDNISESSIINKKLIKDYMFA